MLKELRPHKVTCVNSEKYTKEERFRDFKQKHYVEVIKYNSLNI